MAEFSIRWVASLTAAAVLAVTAALALAACGGGSHVPQVASLGGNSSGAGPSTPRVASLGKNASGNGKRPRASATAAPKGGPTLLVDEWAACERSHGDPNQADPTIDAYGVINITTPPLGEGGPAGDPHDATGTCSQYLAAAQSALRAADPVPDPQGPDQAEQLKYVGCMRANGVPNYPYPQGNTTDFIGSGVDPNSPLVENANKVCGNKLHLPAWWISGTGPPGDITVGAAGLPNGGNPPPCAFERQGCRNGGRGGAVPVPRGPGGAGANAGSGAGG